MTDHILPNSWWRNRMHISWFIAWLSVAILIGIAISPIADTTFTDISWLIVAISLFFAALVKQKKYMILAVIAAGGLCGLWRGSMEHMSIIQYQPFFGKHVVVHGRVSEDTSYGQKGDLRIRLTDVQINTQKMPGTIWVSTAETADIKRGDTIALSGILGEGFGNIPASMFRAKINSIIRPNPGDVGRRVRDWFGAGVNRSMSSDDANLAMAYLVGQKLTVSETLVDQFRTVGLIHAVVASGYHLTVLVGVIRRIFVKISKYLTTLLSGAMIGAFILITGFSPSMSRAGLVSGLSLAAWYYGRTIHPLVLLPFAAAITTLVQPEYVWGDVGWYLSFAAFAGVLLVAPLINSYFWGKRKPSVVREVLVATFAAQLVTLPLTIHVFGYYSMYALLANLLVVPLIPLTMLLTFLTGLMGLAVPAVAALFGAFVSLILQYMTSVVGWIAHLPGSKTEISFGMPALVVSYVLISVLVLLLWRKTGYDFRKDKSEKLL